MSDRWVLIGGLLFRHGQFEKGNVLVDGGQIVEVGPDVGDGEVIVDATDHWVFPGLLDVHVHFREPGLQRKEGWDYGSRGALHGGVTSVLEIQNNPPLCVSPKRLAEREDIARRASRVDFGLFPNLLPESVSSLAAMAPDVPGFKLFMGGSTGMPGVTDYGLLRDLFAAAAAAGRPVVVHAEDESVLRRDQAHFANADARSHHWIRSAEAETVAIAAAIELAAATGASLHVFHISTGRGAEMVAQGKKSGIDVTGSTSPHYLLLTHEDTAKLGNFLKVNPSVKTPRDRDRLCELLADGSLVAIGTDHAPHPADEKRLPYLEAPSGLPTIDLVLPLCLEIAARGVPLERVLDAMGPSAAECFGIQHKGRIEAGYDADLSIVNPAEERTVQGTELPSRSRWSPFEGWHLRGFPSKVFRRGKVVFEDGECRAAGGGVPLELQPPVPNANKRIV